MYYTGSMVMSDDLTLIGFFQRYPNDAAAEAWFVSRRWPNGITWPYCNGKFIEKDE